MAFGASGPDFNCKSLASWDLTREDFQLKSLSHVQALPLGKATYFQVKSLLQPQTLFPLDGFPSHW